MRLLDAAREASEYLERSGIEDPYIDAELLVLHAAGMDRLAAFMENPEIGKNLVQRIRRLTHRRGRGEPLQYITGHVDFMGLKIRVGKGVLIPRPETELVAREAIEEGKRLRVKLKALGKRSSESLRILDLCTGTGCIALTLAKEFSDSIVYGTDLSEAAVRFARKNRKDNGITNTKFIRGPLFGPVGDKGRFDLIVSNPPYIKKGEIETLQREIREWEPVEALDGGETGLDFYRNIFSEAGPFLNRNGMVIVELGFGQAEAVRTIAKTNGFEDVEIKKDYSGIERIFKAARTCKSTEERQ